MLLVEAEADVVLQGCWGQPLLEEAALEKGDTRAEVGQAVHPAGALFPAEYLWSKQKKRSMVNNTTTRAMSSPSAPPPQQGESCVAQKRAV